MFFEHCQDAIDREGEDGQKIWVTKSTNRTNLFEFVNKTMYRDDKPTRIYSLPKPFTVRHKHSVKIQEFFYHSILREKEFGKIAIFAVIETGPGLIFDKV